ncbi:MAG: 3-phosphoserine/phosphohydroxythreonine transaminase [Candidatus Cloacimonas sp.]|nr:3-phosphoserine/phosphohydroxythreonine transaminase [Candidatus Cloacimonadota bacterium]
MENRVFNFSAGPATLPEEVLLEVQKDLLNYKGMGLSVMEMSHRSKEYVAIFDDAVARVKKIMGLGDDYEVLFLSGGATTQFLMTALNFCPEDKVANYILSGNWAMQAYKEAKKIGKKTHVAATTEENNYSNVPKEFKLSENPAFLHITTNNTLFGTQIQDLPEIPKDVPLFADMSSDIMCKPMDFSKFSLIYAGAQKNIGPAGVTLVVIKKDILDRLQPNLPTMMSYETHIKKESMHNTPPTFPIYIVGLVMKWIEEKGGLAAIEKMNIEKANYIYDAIDNSNGYYKGTANKEDRSLMNITYRLPNEDLEAKFISEAKAKKLVTLKGHRSVGGIRASIYNAMPMAGAKALADFMKEFQKNNPA